MHLPDWRQGGGRDGQPAWDAIEQLAHHLAAYVGSERLFTTADGGPLFYRAWPFGWDKARAEVGLTADTHDMRHFFARAH